MGKTCGNTLVSIESSRKIDEEAQTEWGFNTYALIEAAGRNCAQVFSAAFPGFSGSPSQKIAAFVGPGNNGADALVMLRYWLLQGLVYPDSSLVIVSRFPSEDRGPLGSLILSSLIFSLRKMGVFIFAWDEFCLLPREEFDIFHEFDIILDGIAGTGVRGPLEGASADMVKKAQFSVPRVWPKTPGGFGGPAFGPFRPMESGNAHSQSRYHPFHRASKVLPLQSCRKTKRRNDSTRGRNFPSGTT